MTNLMNLFYTWMKHNLTIKAKKIENTLAIILIVRKGQKQRHRKIECILKWKLE